MFFEVINKKQYTIKKGTLWPLCSNLSSCVGELENSWFHFLMSRTVLLSFTLELSQSPQRFNKNNDHCIF